MTMTFHSFWNLFCIADFPDLLLHPCVLTLRSVLCCPLGHSPAALLLLPETQFGECRGFGPLGTPPPLHSFAVGGRYLTRLLLPPVGSTFFWPFTSHSSTQGMGARYMTLAGGYSVLHWTFTSRILTSVHRREIAFQVSCSPFLCLCALLLFPIRVELCREQESSCLLRALRCLLARRSWGKENVAPASTDAFRG